MARIGRDAKTSGGSLNIQKLYGYASFDIISELTSGEPQYSLEEGNEQSHIETFSVHAKYSTFRNVLVHFPPLDKILLSLLFSLSAKRRKENWNKGFERLTRRLQDPGPAVGSDIITSVVEKLNESKQRYITKTELLTNCLGFIIASSQLTTLVLTAMTYLLVQNPHTLTHLVMEIRNNFREERDITMASTSSLPYLEAVLKETLRIHHPTPIALPRVIPPEGRVIHGQMVPGKTIIGINLQVIQNCPDHWLEPRVFHSERFLPQEDPRYDTRFDSDNQVAFQPFSTGLRNCIGAKLFSVQAKLVLSRLLWNFDIGWAVKDPAWLNQKAWLGFEHKPLFLRITKRGQR
ncbi:MAG: hypothetical protein LQ340_001724 [Diploschistes diacapsis]|nr:MAG: hypothetical protein LQ340_001724 [Diploschistes diacapsis]